MARDTRQSAKEAVAQARAARQAEKARKRASTDPADMGRYRQVYRAYQITHEYDRALPYWMIGSFVVTIAVFWSIHFLWGNAIYLTVLGVLAGFLLALAILVRRAKRATYKRYAGQAGSAEVALQMLPKQWTSSAVVAVNKQTDTVHRTLGPGGLVLIGEGEPGRLKTLLASEARKHQRVSYGVDVITIIMGDKEGQVPLDKLADHIRKLPKILQANQITDIKARLRALDAVRPQAPIPKGPMPTNPRQIKGTQRAMRGR